MQAAQFMRQFGGKQYWKRMLSHSNDKEAMREFNERLGQLLQLSSTLTRSCAAGSLLSRPWLSSWKWRWSRCSGRTQKN